MVKGPVCRKDLDISNSLNNLYINDNYYFCSYNCKCQFKKNTREYEVVVIIRKRKGQPLS
jgi:YHS domain-containing protein